LAESGENGQRSPTLADFASAKQDLYNAIGDLVIASQELTAEDKEPRFDATKGRKRRGTEGARHVVKAGEALKVKVQSICLNVSFMVEEDKIRNRKSSNGTTSLVVGTPGRYPLVDGVNVVSEVKMFRVLAQRDVIRRPR
jgi:hypothetical protein